MGCCCSSRNASDDKDNFKRNPPVPDESMVIPELTQDAFSRPPPAAPLLPPKRDRVSSLRSSIMPDVAQQGFSIPPSVYTATPAAPQPGPGSVYTAPLPDTEASEYVPSVYTAQQDVYASQQQQQHQEQQQAASVYTSDQSAPTKPYTGAHLTHDAPSQPRSSKCPSQVSELSTATTANTKRALSTGSPAAGFDADTPAGAYGQPQETYGQQQGAYKPSQGSVQQPYGEPAKATNPFVQQQYGDQGINRQPAKPQSISSFAPYSVMSKIGYGPPAAQLPRLSLRNYSNNVGQPFPPNYQTVGLYPQPPTPHQSWAQQSDLYGQYGMQSYPGLPSQLSSGVFQQLPPMTSGYGMPPQESLHQHPMYEEATPVTASYRQSHTVKPSLPSFDSELLATYDTDLLPGNQPSRPRAHTLPVGFSHHTDSHFMKTVHSTALSDLNEVSIPASSNQDLGQESNTLDQLSSLYSNTLNQMSSLHQDSGSGLDRRVSVQRTG